MRRRLLITATFVGIAVVTYGQLLRSTFLADDYNLLFDVLHHAPFGDIAATGGERVIRPLSFATVWLDHAIFGLHPWGYFATSVAIHVANSLAVVLLAGRLLGALVAPWGPERERSNATAPLLAGLVFLVHPSHTEAVSWISARVDLVATACSLAAMMAWLPRERGVRGARRHAASLVAFGAALASKESVLILPLVLSLFEAARAWVAAEWGTPVSVRLRACARVALAPRFHYLMLVAYLGIRWAVVGTLGSYGTGSQFGGSVARVIANAAEGVARAFLPGMPRWAWVVAGGVVVGAAIVAVVSARRDGAIRRSSVSMVVVLLCVLICSAPMATLGVSPIATGGERLVYLPSVFSCIAIAWLVSMVRVRGTWARVVPVGTVVVAAASLVWIESVWVDAGRAADAVVQASATWQRDEPVVVLVLPDSIRGALVYRNGLDAMLRLEHGWTKAKSTVVTFPRLSDRLEPIGVMAGDGPGRWWIDPCGRDDLLAPAGADAKVVRVESRRFEIELDEQSRGSAVWSYSAGALRRVDVGDGVGDRLSLRC